MFSLKAEHIESTLQLSLDSVLILAMPTPDVTYQLGQRARRGVEELLGSLDEARDGRPIAGIPDDALYSEAVAVVTRLLFLLMAEARGLLTRCRQRTEPRCDASTVLQHFRTLEAHSSNASSPVSDIIISQLLESLQQPKRRGDNHLHNFGSLDIEYLGRIYECLLNYTAKSVADGRADSHKRRLHVVPGETRRRSGAHYTPRQLTETTVQYVLDPLVYHGAADGRPHCQRKLRPADEILDLKICDIACGSGAFLVQAGRYLADRLVETWNEPGQSAVMKARQLVAQHCLYGVDNDPQATEITKHSLWLLAEARDGRFTFIDDHVRCGDALVDGRFNELEVDRPFDWHREFPEVFAVRGGFDAIVGNPPYISLYSRDSQSSHYADQFGAYAKRRLGHVDGAEVLSGRVNTYLLFLVRSLQLLNPERGVAALVLPDTILTNQSYEPMRRVLTENGRLMKIARYRDAMFRGASVGTAVVVCGKPATGHRVALIDEPANGAAASIIHESCAEIAGRSSCSWLPQETSHISRVMLPTAGTVPIGEFAFVKDGINPGSRQTREWLLTDTPDGDLSLRLCMEGNWIEPFHITRKRLWVRYDAARLTPDERKAGTSLREQWIFDSPKIVYRQTASHLIAALDHEGLCARNSVHCIVLKKYDETVLYALLAFLNSDVCRDYYQSLTGETRKTFPQVHVASVKRLRVPERILDPSHRDAKRLAQLAASVSSNSATEHFANKRGYATALKKLNILVAQMVANSSPPVVLELPNMQPKNVALSPICCDA